MPEPKNQPARIRTTANPHHCANCPPDLVCAWACVQGASMSEIVIGAALTLDGGSWAWELPGDDVAPTHEALDRSFNDPLDFF